MNEPLTFSFETRAADLLLAAELYDQKNRRNTSRGIQLLGATVILLMFVSYAFSNITAPQGWILLALGVGFVWYVWKYPGVANRRFAAQKAEHSPHFTFTVTEEGMDVEETPAHYRIAFNGGGAVGAWEHDGVIAFSYDKNRLIAIPLDQIGGDAADRLRLLLRQGLGDRYEVVDKLQKQL